MNWYLNAHYNEGVIEFIRNLTCSTKNCKLYGLDCCTFFFFFCCSAYVFDVSHVAFMQTIRSNLIDARGVQYKVSLRTTVDFRGETPERGVDIAFCTALRHRSFLLHVTSSSLPRDRKIDT
jgi:hypothetical protein